MPRNYKRKKPVTTSAQTMQDAVDAVKDGMSIRIAANAYGVPKSTLLDKCKQNHTQKVGRPTIFSPEEEESFVEALITLADWGFPLVIQELKELVKSCLDRSGRQINEFVSNKPGKEWCISFLKRHDAQLSQRFANNIKRVRALVCQEEMQKYFDNLAKSLENVPAENVFNFDETNLVDDPRKSKVIAKRGTKYIDRVMNTSKAAVSVMFSGSASGVLLPPYVVYKAEHMWDSWKVGGPKGAPCCSKPCCRAGTRYNRTSNGWFDGPTFFDWFATSFLPHAKELPGMKVCIGDNLSSHFSTEVLKLCKQYNIRFVCLPPNSTHLCQPLDVAFFHPLKIAWGQVLEEYKRKNHKTASFQKDRFPPLLKKLVDKIGQDDRIEKNLQSGFRACGIVPLDPQAVLKKLKSKSADDLDTSANKHINEAVIGVLKSMRFDSTAAKNPRRKKMLVEPGKSVSADSPSKTPSTSTKRARVYSSDSNESSESDITLSSDSSQSENESENHENDMKYATGDFVAVVYDSDWFIAEIIDISDENSDYRVNFMHPPGGKNTQFYWPSKKDECWLPPDAILLKLDDPPTPISSRLWSISNQSIRAIQEKYVCP